MRWLWAMVALASALLVGPAMAVEAPDGGALTVDYVAARIEQLDGKTVRLRGEVDNCGSLTCNICLEGRASACLPLSLRSDGVGQRLTEELYRFTVITVDARIDASCSRRNVVCTDRGLAVQDAQVLTIVARRPATEGIFTTSGYRA